jgi:RimJ/RimL family protein N-acetyltransferase
VDGTAGSIADLAPFAELGFDTDASVVMTARSVHEPPRPNGRATIRPLSSDEDWAQQVALAAVDEAEYSTWEFNERRTRAHRSVMDAGHGQWFGAFLDDRLVSSMGIVRAGPGLARFQDVKTHPEARGQGLAGTLVHAASRFAFEELGAQTLVMVADPDYLAIRVYRSVGFDDTETQLQATLTPPVDSA